LGCFNQFIRIQLYITALPDEVLDLLDLLHSMTSIGR